MIKIKEKAKAKKEREDKAHAVATLYGFVYDDRKIKRVNNENCYHVAAS